MCSDTVGSAGIPPTNKPDTSGSHALCEGVGGKQVIRVLVVDDSPEDSETYRRFLREDAAGSFIIDQVDSAAAAREACECRTPDCVLLDFQLPDGDGIEVLAEWSDGAGGAIFPVVMLTGQGDEEVAVSAMKLGAMDYLIKNRLTPDTLARAVRGAVQKCDLIRTVRRQQEEKDRLIAELQEALQHIRTLRGILPICSFCKKIRNDKNYWEQVETYVTAHTNAEFSHSICPDCLRLHYSDFLGA